jgi:hypothetical protein
VPPKKKKATKDKEGYYIWIKDLIHQKGIILINTCPLKNKAPKLKKKLTELKGEILRFLHPTFNK